MDFNGISATNHTRRDIQYLPYAGFFSLKTEYFDTLLSNTGILSFQNIVSLHFFCDPHMLKQLVSKDETLWNFCFNLEQATLQAQSLYKVYCPGPLQVWLYPPLNPSLKPDIPHRRCPSVFFSDLGSCF